jgi:endonuclease YncB( thermonuclease family)
MSNPPWTWTDVALNRIIDGDSIVLDLAMHTTIDAGFHVITDVTSNSTQKVRLNRINCPQGHSEGGRAATAFTTQMLTGSFRDVTVVKTYKYGDEWMAEVIFSDGTNLSDALVSAGHAVYWDGEGPRPSDS